MSGIDNLPGMFDRENVTMFMVNSLGLIGMLSLVLALWYLALCLLGKGTRKTVRNIVVDLLKTMFWMTIVLTPLTSEYYSALTRYTEIGLWDVFLNALIIIGVVIMATTMMAMHPFFRWSPIQFFIWLLREKGNDSVEYCEEPFTYDGRGSQAEEAESSLIEIIVSDYAMALPFALILIFILPTMVTWEERWFRQGTNGWVDGIIRSLIFGLSHFLLAFVPMGAALAISVTGLWLTQIYMTEGLDAAITNHLTYDTILVAPLAAGLLFETVVDWLSMDSDELAEMAEAGI